MFCKSEFFYAGRHAIFPLFTYSEDGKERRENITPKALTLFQIFYDDDGITRADIFHYVYALLHHPAYRTRYAENLNTNPPPPPFWGEAPRLPPRIWGPPKPPKSPNGNEGEKRAGKLPPTRRRGKPGERGPPPPSPTTTRKPARNFSTPSPPPARNSPTCT